MPLPVFLVPLTVFLQILFLGVSEDLDVSVMRRLSSESDKDVNRSRPYTSSSSDCAGLCQLAKQELERRERIFFTGNFQRLRSAMRKFEKKRVDRNGRRKSRLKVVYMSSDFGQTVEGSWRHGSES